VAGSLSPDLIDTVQRHIYDALARTSDGSTLPEDEQDKMLAQACAEACDILHDWRNSFQWEDLSPSAGAPIAAAIPEWERVKPFLDPLKQALTRIVRQMQPEQERIEPAAHIDEAIKAAAQTARRYPRLNRDELFNEASARIDAVRDEVCQLAHEMRAGLQDRAKRQRWRKRARSALLKVAGLVLTLSLAMAGAGPHDVRQHIPEWGHEAVKVLMVHSIAQSAQPGVRITPPRLGPHMR
jgi:hypothetical protein